MRRPTHPTLFYHPCLPWTTDEQRFDHAALGLLATGAAPCGRRTRSCHARPTTGASDPIASSRASARSACAAPASGREPRRSRLLICRHRDRTRSLLETLIRTGLDEVQSVSLLLSNGANSAYTTQAKDVVLAKANLSTLNEPPTLAVAMLFETAPSQPPSSAMLPPRTPAEMGQFLTLVWEVSVVHAEGFYLYTPDLPDSAFAGGDAQIALLVQFGTPVASPELAAWTNCLLLGAPLDSANGAAVATVTMGNGP